VALDHTSSHGSVHKPISDTCSSNLTKLKNSRLQGDDIGGGWTKHVCPHKDFKYFYNSDLGLVTTENVQDLKACRSPAEYQEITAKHLPSECLLDSNELKVVNHETKKLGGVTLGSFSEWNADFH
jgi:hypothetical protein